MTVASTILEQLGGNKFIVMTGSKNFLDCGNALSMKLAGNKSKANHLKITLNGLDLYNMDFFYCRVPYFDTKKMVFKEAVSKQVIEYKDVCFDQLQELFSRVTGLDTRL